MRERRNDRVRRWSPLPRRTDRDRCDAIRNDRLDVPQQFARPDPDWPGRDVGRVTTERESNFGINRRRYDDSVSHEQNWRRQDGFLKRKGEEYRRFDDDTDDEGRDVRMGKPCRFAEDIYPRQSPGLDRLGPVRANGSVARGRDANFMATSHRDEELYFMGEAEPTISTGSRSFSDLVRPGKEILRIDDSDPFRSTGSRSHSVSARPGSNRYGCSEMEPCREMFQAKREEQEGMEYYGDRKNRNLYFPNLPPSCGEFVSMKFPLEAKKPVNVNSGCGYGDNDVSRVANVSKDTAVTYRMPPAVYTKVHSGYFDGQSSKESREEVKENLFHHHGYFDGQSSRWPGGEEKGKPFLKDRVYGFPVSSGGPSGNHYDGCSIILDSSLNDFSGGRQGEDIGRNCNRHYEARPAEAVALPNEYSYRKIYPYTQMEGFLLKPDFIDATSDKVDRDDTVLRHGIRETRVVDNSRSLKGQYPNANVASSTMVELDGEAPRFRAYSVERKDAYLDDERQQLTHGSRFDLNARMHPDANGSPMKVERDKNAYQFRSACVDERKETYLDNGKQQLIQDDDFDFHARIYTDVSRSLGLMVDQDEKALRYTRHHLDGRMEAYLENERMPVGNDNHCDLHATIGHLGGRRDVNLGTETLHLRENFGFNPHMSGKHDERANETRYGTQLTVKDATFQDQYEIMARKGHMTQLTIYRGIDSENDLSSCRSRVSVKERLGGRVKAPYINVKKRFWPGRKALPWAGSIIANKKAFSRNHDNFSDAHRISSHCSQVSVKERLGGRIRAPNVYVKKRVRFLNENAFKRRK